MNIDTNTNINISIKINVNINLNMNMNMNMDMNIHTNMDINPEHHWRGVNFGCCGYVEKKSNKSTNNQAEMNILFTDNFIQNQASIEATLEQVESISHHII